MQVVVILICRRLCIIRICQINLVALLSDRATLHPIRIIGIFRRTVCVLDSFNVGLMS